MKSSDQVVPAAKNSDLAKWHSQADAKKAAVLADKLATASPDASTDFHFDPK